MGQIGPERRLVDSVCRLMGLRWHVQRHEDKYSTGIADLSYACKGVDGWLEAKVLPKWPTTGTILKPVSERSHHISSGVGRGSGNGLRRSPGGRRSPGVSVHIPKFRVDQKNWLVGRGYAGSGHVFMLLQVAEDYLLISYVHLEDLFHGNMTKDDILGVASCHMVGKIVLSEFMSVIAHSGAVNTQPRAGMRVRTHV